jgi:predicted DNA-binding protein (MmcQ/YjbR family)
MINSIIWEKCKCLENSKLNFPFGESPAVFKVNNKMFCIINNESEISLKCDPNLSHTLRDQYKGIIPGYHLNKKHWNTISLDKDVPIDEIIFLIEHSYMLVSKSR